MLADRDGDTASNTVTLSAGVGADHAPIVRDDLVITNISGASAAIAIPSWALLYNDTDADGNVITVTATSGASSGSVSPLSGSPIATVTFADTGNSNGGGFTYAGSTASPQASDIGSVTVVRNQSGSTLTGTGFGDILIGRNGSNDIIANEGNDVLIGGTGADRLTGGAGTDIFGFAAGDSVLTIGGSGTGGTVSGYDVITDFALGNIARLSEMLHFDGAAVVANSVTNGINSALQLHTGSVVASHRITNGMVTFDDADTFAGAVSLATTGDIAAVAQYLTGQDLGDAGATVAFTATLSGVTHTYVFLQGTGAGTSGNASSDILIQVQSVAADSLSASGGQLSLLDTVPPLIAPAGIAGELINLALTGPSADHVGAVTLTITGVPAGWALSEGSSNGDGSWMVQTSDIAALSIISPDDYTGALALDVTVSWTNPDGSTGSETIPDNIEVYAKGVPIFALSGDDFLTASSGSDLLVFSQPIGHDTVYSFDVAEDQIDLIGYAGLTSFAEVLIQLTEDASGNAVIALADGQSIVLQGVHAAALTGNNFVFNQTPMFSNSGIMTIGDGAVMPLSGIVINSGTIALDSTGDETDLQLIHGMTLQGGGQIVLSDSDENFIYGTTSNVSLNNADNTISGAGQLGDGELNLTNAGTINATGTHALVIDTGSNVIHNSGVLEASGTGGLTVVSAIENSNSGFLWANGANLTVLGEVTGVGTATIDGTGVLDFEAILDGKCHLWFRYRGHPETWGFISLQRHHFWFQWC